MTVVLPVKEEPGAKPISPPAVPLITVGPVLVMVVAARTQNVVVVPGVITGAAASDEAGLTNIASSGNSVTGVKTLTYLIFSCYFDSLVYQKCAIVAPSLLLAWAPV